MSEAELYSVAGITVLSLLIAFCGGTIGFIIGIKLAWADAKKLYEPYLFGDK